MNDFDFLVGSWNVHNRRLLDFLDPDSGWEEFPGRTEGSVHFAGGAHFDEITFPTKGVSGLTLRLHDRDSGEWSLNWAGSRTGRLDPPVRGRFAPDGTGEFFGDDTYDGRDVKVRFRWSGISPSTARWEQSFSADGGDTWVLNWTMEMAKVAD